MRHDVSCTWAMGAMALYFVFHHIVLIISFTPEASGIYAVLRIPPMYVGIVFAFVHIGCVAFG
jgi:hypothetical protein